MKKLLISFLFLFCVSPFVSAQKSETAPAPSNSAADSADSGIYEQINVMAFGVNIDSLLTMMFSQFQEKTPDAALISEYEKEYSRWEALADKSPLNNYRRGVYLFIKAVETDDAGKFKKAEKLLKKSSQINKDEEIITDLAEMTAMCRDKEKLKAFLDEQKLVKAQNALSGKPVKK